VESLLVLFSDPPSLLYSFPAAVLQASKIEKIDKMTLEQLRAVVGLDVLYLVHLVSVKTREEEKRRRGGVSV